MSAGTRTGGIWCLFCGAVVPQAHGGHHLWAHGIIWSPPRQGYRNGNGQPPEPLVKHSEPEAMQAAMAPRPPTLWDALEDG
jgi:hypothetical protein